MGDNYKWTNRAGVVWSLTAKYDSSDGLLIAFDVGSDCPYYDDGHTLARVSYDDDGKMNGVYGPGDEFYKL